MGSSYLSFPAGIRANVTLQLKSKESHCRSETIAGTKSKVFRQQNNFSCETVPYTKITICKKQPKELIRSVNANGPYTARPTEIRAKPVEFYAQLSNTVATCSVRMEHILSDNLGPKTKKADNFNCHGGHSRG